MPEIAGCLPMRGYRLEVRTRDFQSLSRGSIPRIPTIQAGTLDFTCAEVVEWQTRTLEVRMLKRLAGSTPVLGIFHFPKTTLWAVGSVVEHLVHTEGVTGSNPVLPILFSPQTSLTSHFAPI